MCTVFIIIVLVLTSRAPPLGTTGRLRGLGLLPFTKAELPSDRKFDFVAFSAPPSGSSDYTAEVGSLLARLGRRTR